jgi:acetate kinase
VSPSGPLVVLCVNSGSSSLKTALFEVDGAAEHELGRAAQPVEAGDYRAALDGALGVFDERGLPAPAAAGHRVVHGGPSHAAPVLVDERVLAELRAVAQFAPLHVPAAISGIEAVGARWDIPQVACFDTAFHHDMPPVAQRLPLPDALTDAGLRRYGFHGLSYEYVVGAVGAAELGGAVIAHLGNGASMCAVSGGRSIATTMGFSTLDGLVMGTRVGSLDPGVILHLLRSEGMKFRQLEDLLYNKSGLLGLSGISADMKTLLASNDPHARDAVEQYCYAIVRHLGSLAAALGGLDALVFTGGIGENAPAVRAQVCEGTAWLGLVHDPQANAAGGPIISQVKSAVRAWVIATDEERVIARHARHLLGL